MSAHQGWAIWTKKFYHDNSGIYCDCDKSDRHHLPGQCGPKCVQIGGGKKANNLTKEASKHHRASVPRTGSLHQPHLAPAWMQSAQDLALALTHSFPSGRKTKTWEGRESRQCFAWQLMWNAVGLGGEGDSEREWEGFSHSGRRAAPLQRSLWPTASLASLPRGGRPAIGESAFPERARR